ncbi:hypothetical protein [Sorangium sp. So ce590]|uniref:hypothetical protein n=1 Tax=unclassified Sorangium TaxID=2621164 RepID=UPI003F63876D
MFERKRDRFLKDERPLPSPERHGGAARRRRGRRLPRDGRARGRTLCAGHGPDLVGARPIRLLTLKARFV